MHVVSPFSLSIFTLDDDPESDPSSSPASASPERVLELDFTSPDHPVSSSRPPRRRWTLAMAMTDEGMTDEALVETLERIRIQRESSDTSAVWDVNQDTWNWNLQWEGGIDDKNRELSIPYTTSLPSFPLHHSLSVPPSPKLATAWHTARQALLTCRELVRTERHYLSSLTVLIASETVTLPPPLMIHYASQLAAVSQRFLTRLEADPSALGVAAAFLGIEEAVESAFVGWCGVVGTWFEAASSPIPSPKRRLSKGRSEEDIPEFGASAAHAGNGSLRRNGNSWRRNVPTMTSLNGSTSSPSQGLTPSFSYSFLNWRKDRSANGPSTNGNTKKPPVRDLAILPTQRVLRYVLIYRDLLAHIPSTSPSRALVERALEAATRIAQKCDRAQDNSAFLQKPEPSFKISLARVRKASTG
ncbi:hypothetical protein AX14_006842 [Amanita brunnescens Koide BX004]|nr:hypothetical protein AX14_006842 [Amanita brunnescens Koide BX004]